jgi:hypothetical protein
MFSRNAFRQNIIKYHTGGEEQFSIARGGDTEK